MQKSIFPSSPCMTDPMIHIPNPWGILPAFLDFFPREDSSDDPQESPPEAAPRSPGPLLVNTKAPDLVGNILLLLLRIAQIKYLHHTGILLRYHKFTIAQIRNCTLTI